MKVFITGATGFIGQAVTTELLSHNHSVLGLSRSTSSASLLSQLGAEPHHGSIENLPSLATAVKKVDAVIHLAFNPPENLSDFPQACANERAAIRTMAENLGKGKALIITSGTMVLPCKGELVDEDTPPVTAGFLSERVKSENLIKSLNIELGIRGIVVRLSPVVHGEGDERGFIPTLGSMGKKNGVVPYIGGRCRWPGVHRDDAAVLYRKVLERGKEGGVYHAVAEESVEIKEIMRVVGRKLDLPVVEKNKVEAEELLGGFASIISVDNLVSSERTRKELGWIPERDGVLGDIEKVYF